MHLGVDDALQTLFAISVTQWQTSPRYITTHTLLRSRSFLNI